MIQDNQGQTYNGFAMQERLERTNKLQQKPRKEVAVQNSGGSSSSKEKDRRKTTSARYGSTQSLASNVDSPLGKLHKDSDF